jgi:hypothetical protein
MRAEPKHVDDEIVRQIGTRASAALHIQPDKSPSPLLPFKHPTQDIVFDPKSEILVEFQASK